MLKSILLGTSLICGTALVAHAQSAPTFPCANAPTLAKDQATFPIPGDSVLMDQQSINCFAWKEFIGATWPQNGGAAAYGEPRDMAPVRFETYHNIHDFLSPDGSPPDKTQARFEGYGNGSTKVMSRTAKLGNNFDPSADISEAAPSIAWLADKNGNLAWYEILVNDREYDYIIENKLYNSEEQYKQVTKEGGRIDLPRGVVGGAVGAIEFKAAWLAVPDPEDAKWERYKLSEGVFCTEGQEEAPDCTQSTIALIGLHIIQKTASQPSWIWASFDHIDNVPDQAWLVDGKTEGDYLFFDNACTPRPVPAECVSGKKMAEAHVSLTERTKAYLADQDAPTQTTCTPNMPPKYQLGPFKGGHVEKSSACQPYPIQATRVYSLPDTNENPIVSTNMAAQAMISAVNADSVFQYYQLINVLWSDTPVDENAGHHSAPKIPLSKTGFRPQLNTFPMANPVMETYVQQTSCLECHSNASIAASPLETRPKHASDYSFIFGMAGPKPK